MSPDGRVARRDRNRCAVVDAVVTLVAEGVLEPTPEQVATRCGVSPRSVYRYFDDREALMLAAVDLYLARLGPLTRIAAIGEGPLDERTARFVDSRLALHEAVATTARAFRRRAETSPAIARQVERNRLRMREQIELHFAPELAAMTPATRRATVDVVDSLTQFEALDHARLHLGRTVKQTRSMLRHALGLLLQPTKGTR